MPMQIYAVRVLRILERVVPIGSYQKIYHDAIDAAKRRAFDSGHLPEEARLSIGDIDEAVGLERWKAVYDQAPQDHLESSSAPAQR